MSVTAVDDFQIVPADREKEEKATEREAVASNSRGNESLFAPGWVNVLQDFFSSYIPYSAE